MTDFGFSIIWSVVIGLMTGLLDYVVCHFIADRRFKTAAREAIEATATDADAKLKRAEDALASSDRMTAGSRVWGVELSTVSLGINLSSLGLWITNRNVFPIIERWNTQEIDRTLYVWLIVLVVNIVLVLASMIMKHLHAHRIEDVGTPSRLTLKTLGKWIKESPYALASDFLGYLAVFGSLFLIASRS